MNFLKSLFKLKIIGGLVILVALVAIFNITRRHKHKEIPRFARNDAMKARNDKAQARNDKARVPNDAKKKEIYFCPMHPSVTSDRPGRCPICGMPFEKIENHPEQHEKRKVPEVPGRVSFTLPKERQQLIGVTKSKVIKKELKIEIRASGKVAFDPDLFTAIEEYREGLVAQKEMAKSPFREMREQADALVSASETKLKLMGLSQSQIETMAAKSPINLLLPKGLAWIYAEVFEYEISLLKVGQSLEITAPSLPGKIFTGVISSISPVLNTPTRTFRVRGEVPNPDGMLKPDTFVNVKIGIDLGNQLAIPMSAVLHSGDKNFVFVIKGEGEFEPRAVSVGIRAGEYYEILSGLSDGETVVTSANFLIDSESRLRSAISSEGEAPEGGEPQHHH